MDRRVAIVTGAGRGIGEATARALAREGFAIGCAGKHRDAVERVARSIVAGGGEAIAIEADVGEERDVDAIFEVTTRAFGGVDLLINNAGVLARGLVQELTPAQFDAVMRVNVRGVFLCARAAFSSMIARGRGGSIVNVASLSGVAGVEKFAGYSAYVASKFAVVGLTEALAVEGRAHGIRVNAISPGAVDTAMLKQADPSLKSSAKPEDIARSIVFLALDPLLTGANLPIFSNA